MCWEEKIQWQCYPQASERACVMPPLFGQGKIIFFFLKVICNSLLLLKSLPINIINCIKFYVNCFFFFNNVIYFIQMLATINTPKVQAPFGVSLLHLVLIIQGYNQNYMEYVYNLNTISI